MNREITLYLTDVGTFVNHALVPIFNVVNLSFNGIRKNKSLAKMPDFTVPQKIGLHISTSLHVHYSRVTEIHLKVCAAICAPK